MEEPKDGEKLGQDFAGATENEPVEAEIGEEEGFHHSSENPTTNFEFAEKNPQIPSESCPTAPPDTVKSPPQNPQFPSDSPDRNSLGKELLGSKIDNDEDAGLLDDPEYSLSSEESSDVEVKTENGVEVTKKGASEAAEVTQPTENCAMEVELKPQKPGEIYPVSTEATNQSFSFDAHLGDGSESGTEEEQAAFMKELENFFRERSLEFKPPKFYGEGLNCLKLWRAVTRLGGYDRVTSCKLWRQVGESFKPPKTCTTVSWSFRCFYEKALLVYERHKVQGGELHVAPSPLSEPVGVEAQVGGSQASGSGRARRDAAARAMQGWHSQRLLGNGEVGDPIIKDKSSVSWPKRDKQLKSLSVLKRKKHSSLERAVKVARTKGANPRDGQMASPAVRMDTMVVDVGPAADWVKINVRRTKDCFEVYALVPGLLREEVRVQSDAAGRLVISGEPEQPDNPWGVTPFKKVISLPSRIDAHQTSAVVTLHGQLFVRAPFEQSDL